MIKIQIFFLIYFSVIIEGSASVHRMILLFLKLGLNSESFRASKSRSIVIQNGRVLDVSPFSFYNETIPSIHSNPVRFLGRSIDVSLCDRQVVSAFKTRFCMG